MNNAHTFRALEFSKLPSTVYLHARTEDLDLVRVHRCSQSQPCYYVHEQSSRVLTGVCDENFGVFEPFGAIDADGLVKNET